MFIVGISLEYTLALAHRCTESHAKVSQASPFWRLELTQGRVCSLFFHPLVCVCCVLCVRKEMWNTPGWRWKKPLDNLMAMSGLGGWDSGTWSAMYYYSIRAMWNVNSLVQDLNSGHCPFPTTASITPRMPIFF